MRNRVVGAILEHQSVFGLELARPVLETLADYHENLIEHNALLHLVAPCSPEEFATRHILESLTLLKYLPADAKFVDVGSGGGLPAIPCLIVREDLRGKMIESKEKKAAFLNTAREKLGLDGRSEVVAKQFNEAEPGDAAFVTCRALDKFSDRLQRLIKWSDGRRLLLFGGEQMGQLLERYGVLTDCELMPLSERRYLFVGKD